MSHTQKLLGILNNRTLSPVERFEQLWKYNDTVLGPGVAEENSKDSAVSKTIRSFCIFAHHKFPIQDWQDLVEPILDGVRAFVDSSSADQSEVPKLCDALYRVNQRTGEFLAEGRFDDETTRILTEFFEGAPSGR